MKDGDGDQGLSESASSHSWSLPGRTTFPSNDSSSYFRSFGTFNGWITLLGAPILDALGRTAATTLIGIVLLSFLSMLTGYGLAGLRRRDQMIVYNVYLLQMVIPTVLIIIPQFLLVQYADRPGAGQRPAGQPHEPSRSWAPSC